MEIDRDVHLGEGPNGIDVRLYEYNGNSLPSVTTVLKTRNEDTSALDDWQSRNDGEGDNAFHEHLFWYSRHVGTLGHWHALSSLGEVPWSEDEAASLWALNNVHNINDDSTIETQVETPNGDSMDISVDGKHHTEIHDATPREVLYSVEKNHHAVESWGEFHDEYNQYAPHSVHSSNLVDKAMRDVNFFEAAQKRLWSKIGLDEESVIAAEQYLFNDDDGYAGQVDLVYEDTDGKIVVADLKSSSGCYSKHKMQGAAYARAVEVSDRVDVESVDRIEVMRAHPRSGQMCIHSNIEATPVHTSQYWKSSEKIDELWSDFEQLIGNFE